MPRQPLLTALSWLVSTVMTMWSLLLKHTISSKTGIFSALRQTNGHVNYIDVHMFKHIQMSIDKRTWYEQLLVVWWQSVHDKVSLQVSGMGFQHPRFNFISQESEASCQLPAGVQAFTVILHTQKKENTQTFKNTCCDYQNFLQLLLNIC